MQYISVDEFLKQSEKVRRNIIDWWQPEVGDIYCNLYNGQENNVLVINECQFHFKSFKDDIKKFGVPLLTEGKLRQHIEFLTNGHIETEYDSQTGYDIKIFTDKPYRLKYNFIDLGTDYLHALWKVVCKIVGN